jgi:hypothetical protein
MLDLLQAHERMLGANRYLPIERGPQFLEREPGVHRLPHFQRPAESKR